MGTLVTVGIPVYNGEAFIRRAVDSALAQTYADIEVLVVDNASTDGTLEAIAGIDDPRLRVLRNDSNIGAGPNWNRVLAEARGDYVKLLSADDLLTPECISEQVMGMESSDEIVLVTAKRLVIDKDDDRIGVRGPGRMAGHVLGAQAAREMVRSGTNLVGEPSSTLIRVSALEAAGDFDVAAPYCIDMDLWMRLLRFGDLYVIPKVLSSYRVSVGSWSTDVAESQTDDVVELLERVRAHGWFGVTEADVAAGRRKASMNTAMRRVLYAVLAVPATHRQKLLYLFVGGWNTLVGYVLFAALWTLFGSVWHYSAVLALSYTVSALQGYWAYKLVVFKTKTPFVKEFPRFAVVYLVVLALNLVAFPALTRAFGLDPYVSQAVFTGAAVVGSYVANRYFSFRETHRP